MVQPFGNIPQLDNPGVAPAISGISSGIGDLLALKRQRESNTQGFINQLLQNQGAMATQKAANEGALEKASLQAPGNALKQASVLIDLQNNLKSTGRKTEAEALNPQINSLLRAGNLGGSLSGQQIDGNENPNMPSEGQGNLEVSSQAPEGFGLQPPNIGFEQVGGLDTSNLPYETERAKTAQEQARAITATEEGRRAQRFQQEQAAPVVTNASTGITAMQPAAPGSEEIQEIPLFPTLKTQQQRAFKPDGSLTDFGKEVNKSANVLTSLANEKIALIKKIVALDNELGLNQVEKAALKASPDALRAIRPDLSDAQIQAASDFKQAFNELEGLKLADAAKANQGRPTDKDFKAVAAKFPSLISSRESLYSSAASQLVGAEAARLNAHLLMKETDLFNTDVQEFQRLTGRAYDKKVFEKPKEIEVDTLTVIDRILGEGGPRDQVVTFDEPVDSTFDLTPSTPTTPSVTAPITSAGGTDMADLVRRYRSSQGVGN